MGGVNSDITTVVDEIVTPFFCFSFPMFSFLPSLGRGKEEGRGGYLVPIRNYSQPPCFFSSFAGHDGGAGCRRAARTVQCQDIHHTKVSILEEGRFFKGIANHLVELELHGSHFLWCSCRLFWRNHPHRLPVEYCHQKPYLIHSIHTKEFNAKETRCIATTTFDHKRMKKSLLCGWLVMLAVVHIM